MTSQAPISLTWTIKDIVVTVTSVLNCVRRQWSSSLQATTWFDHLSRLSTFSSSTSQSPPIALV